MLLTPPHFCSAMIVKVAAVQAAPIAFDLEKTLDKVQKLATEAVKHGAQLVVFPEAFVSAYPRGYSFGALVGSRADEGRKWFQRYAESSIEIPSPAFSRLQKIASDLKIHFVIGIIERQGGTLYCTMITLGPDGNLLSKHRKLMPTGSERIVWGQGDGSGLKVAKTSIGIIGGLICWENYMPLARMSQYQQGVQIYCAPTADGRQTWPPSMQHIAQEGRCFVISVNQVHTADDFPKDYPMDKARVTSRGGSSIVGPYGEFIAQPVWDKEQIIYADINLDECIQAKMDFDVTGHYARKDVFNFSVNETNNEWR